VPFIPEFKNSGFSGILYKNYQGCRESLPEPSYNNAEGEYSLQADIV
jgi:hypothetical protein